MIVKIKVEQVTYEFESLTTEEFFIGSFLYNSTKPRDVNNLKKLVFEKYIGTEVEQLKNQLDQTPRLFHQIFEELIVLMGAWFHAEAVPLSKEDFSLLEEKKIPPQRAVKVKLFPEHIDSVDDEDIPSEEECCVLFKKLNQIEFDALRSDVNRDTSRSYELLAKTGQDFCIEKKKAEHLASMYPGYYLLVGSVLERCAGAKVTMSVGK